MTLPPETSPPGPPLYVPSGENAAVRSAFDALLDASGPAGPRGVSPPLPLLHGLPDGLTPAELLRREMNRAGSATCPRCDGTGSDPSGTGCVMCHGHGTI